MALTKTFEPIRPLRAPDDGTPFFYYSVLSNVPRVDYGESHWPSRSYWLVPGYRPTEPGFWSR